MEWAVMRLSGAGDLARQLIGANGREREREVARSDSVTAPAEMRLQKIGDRRQLDGCAWSARYGHTADTADSEVRAPVGG